MHTFLIILAVLAIIAVGYLVYISRQPHSTSLPTSNYLSVLKSIMDKAFRSHGPSGDN